MRKQLGYIDDMIEELKSYRREKRNKLLLTIGNWSSCIVLGILVAILLWLAINY